MAQSLAATPMLLSQTPDSRPGAALPRGSSRTGRASECELPLPGQVPWRYQGK
jgi:hypothetical protein